MATPYVISSDLVSAYPAKSLEIAQYIDGFKADLALVQNAQTGTTYSFVAADFTKLVTLSNASPVAVELPLEATVPWSAGTTLRLLNQGAGLVTVAGAVGVTINGTPLTLAQYKGANLIKTGTDTWTFIPFASGVGAADCTPTPTGTYSGFKYLTYTASRTITDHDGRLRGPRCGRRRRRWRLIRRRRRGSGGRTRHHERLPARRDTDGHRRGRRSAKPCRSEQWRSVAHRRFLLTGRRRLGHGSPTCGRQWRLGRWRCSTVQGRRRRRHRHWFQRWHRWLKRRRRRGRRRHSGRRKRCGWQRRSRWRRADNDHCRNNTYRRIRCRLV
jgi:hypothetical protein